MRNRIINNWKTTLVGCSIGLVSIAFVWFGKATFAEVSGFFVSSGLMIWVKDSIFKVK